MDMYMCKHDVTVHLFLWMYVHIAELHVCMSVCLHTCLFVCVCVCVCPNGVQVWDLGSNTFFLHDHLASELSQHLWHFNKSKIGSDGCSFFPPLSLSLFPSSLSPSLYSPQQWAEPAVDVLKDAVPHVAWDEGKRLDSAQPCKVQCHRPRNSLTLTVWWREHSCKTHNTWGYSSHACGWDW